jgi:phage terminase small subunit
MAAATTEGTTEQQKLFAYAYFNNGGNATQAAIEAGYSENTATQTASRLLTYVNVLALIKELNDTLKQKAIVTKEQVAAELAKIGFSDIRKLFDEDNRLMNITELSDDAAACLSGVDVDQLWGSTPEGKAPVGETKKVKMWDKLKALAQLTELYGFNAPVKTAQTTVAGEDVQPVKDDRIDEILTTLRNKK